MKRITFLIILAIVIQTMAYSQSCLPEGITFSNQTEIDIFQTNNPNCTEIQGDVSIYGQNINNLNGLSKITSIEGNLSIINMDTSQSTLLTNLSGLQNITSIGGKVEILGQNGLSNFTGLDNLNSIGDRLNIYHNKNIINLSGLENLTFLGGLSMYYNSSMTSLEGIDNINPEKLNVLRITDNPSLSYCNVLSVCSYLISPNGNISIGQNTIGCRSKSEVLDSCGVVSCFPQGISFVSQTDIENFQSSNPDCKVIGGNVTISGPDINNLSFLASIVSIGGNLEIYDNPNLVNLNGLDNITSINGSLIIGNNNGGNSLLSNLTGLNQLRFLGGDLNITGNDVLSSLLGMENVNSSSINNIYITNNYLLSYCEIKSVCDYLSNQIGEVEINNNSTGCNSESEVKARCANWIPNEIINPIFVIYPNPAKETISIISQNEEPIDEICIYNQTGQVILHASGKDREIDISKIIYGLYIIEIVSNKLRVRHKLMIYN